MISSTARPAPDPELLLVDAGEAARRLCISARKLWELSNRGEVRVTRIGRAVRYDVSDLREFVERSKDRG